MYIQYGQRVKDCRETPQSNHHVKLFSFLIIYNQNFYKISFLTLFLLVLPHQLLCLPPECVSQLLLPYVGRCREEQEEREGESDPKPGVRQTLVVGKSFFYFSPLLSNCAKDNTTGCCKNHGHNGREDNGGGR